MRERILRLVALVVFLFAAQGNCEAAVSLTGDAVFGAGSVILDVDNHKEFLKLSFTAPYSYAEVNKEFGPGGKFEGWQVASQHDMDLLGISANIVFGSTDSAMVARTEQLRDWFGEVKTSTTHIYARGLVSDFIYPTTYNGLIAQKAFSIGVKYDISPVIVDYRISGYAGQDSWGECIFLVRDEGTAPVPGGGGNEGCDAALDPTNPACQQVCLPTATLEKGRACTDGIDNDCDGFADAIDPDCAIRKGRGNK